ncbi:DUF4129 domain-containing protein [Paenibacillus sp. HWE-109]|uniref:DUF4129 domain-containing protein n=1 Tax=Paenibacillus sp. HWE-109 TaxID=1306526 RepID=UPI001EDE9DB5|nr:DUF4129 domain-containing protein [Paenibacillus sp. HWE-109]UKS26738.1 DUF4129 domain-containing protein [Paenibacillus sp. HWE-109]
MTSPIPTPPQGADQSLWLRNLGSAFLFGGFELILFYPLIVLIHLYGSVTPLWTSCLQFWLIFVLGSLLGRVRWVNRLIYEIASSVIVGSIIAFLIQGTDWHSWLFAVIGTIVAYRGLRSAKEGWEAIFPVATFVVAGMIYLAGVPIMGRIVSFQPYMFGLNGFGFCSLILFFFTTNRSQLLNATLASSERAAASSLSTTVKRSSRIWLITFIVLIVAVAYFRQIQHAMLAFLRGAILWMLELFRSDAPANPPEPSPSAPPPVLPPAGPAGDPSWLSILMHYVQVVVGYLLVIAFILFVLYLIVSKLAPLVASLLRRLMNRSLSEQQGADVEGFTDEKENLLTWHELPRLWWQQAMNRREQDKSAAKWAQLPNNQERIRLLYRIVMRQAAKSGYSYKKSLTPNETELDLRSIDQLPDQTIQAVTSVYNKIRYGNEDISDQELDQLLRTIDPGIRNQVK